MFSARTYSKAWIEAVAKRSDTQAVVVEKCILALALVGRLAEAGLPFVFKGGTSLILHLDPVRRLSIDVDIACQESLERVQEVLQQVADGQPFIGWEHQAQRDAENPPTKYFRILYRSALEPEAESSIQLDVLIAEALYPVIEERPVNAPFVEVERKVLVRLPCVNSLLGDKLSAFAPTTIGVLYEPVSRKTGLPTEPRPIRVMKQLFDVSELFTVATDLRVVARSYRAHFERQNHYRGGKFNIEEALDDTLAAAYCLSQIDLRPKEEHDRTRFFRTRVKALNTHLMNRKLALTEAKTAAARAALLASLLKTGRLDQTFEALRIVPTERAVLSALKIEGRWQKLQSLRKTNIEAFYRWHQAQLLAGL